jgi:uncharacterized membrane protein
VSVLAPQALLLAVPLALLLWRFARVPGAPLPLRIGILAALVLALAQPRLSLHSAGSDLIIVVDRSRSMPPDSDGKAEELLKYQEPQRRPGDRLGVVTFGREPRVELPPTASAVFSGFTRPVDPDGSDLAAALDAAGDLIPAERSGRVLVISDGKATGADARGAARRLAARGIPIDFRALAREGGAVDLAVTSMDLPESVAAEEPFQLTATVRATREVDGSVLLRRNGQPLVKGPFHFRAGENVLPFRDLVEAAGLAAYELTVQTPDDRVPENDVGRGVLRVEGPPRVLLISQGGRRGELARALEGAGIRLEVRPPFPVTLNALDGVGAVVLEDVPASALSEAGLSVLEQFVRVAGGGLLMTGGRHSFGEGGYRKSPVEEVLPVSLEMRQEQRRASLAMSILMDCSCSMGVQVPDGRTKMQLAAEGAVAALTLLNENDEASVTVIDTEPHTLFPLSPVSKGLPLDKVASAFSGGGGIYIGVALRDGRDQILKSSKPTRHVVLFADAADSELPDDYQRTLADLIAHQVTVSVIGMGTEHDSDANLLKDVAARGQGRIYFAEDPTALPRIFSEETIAVARATFVDTPAALSMGGDLPQLGGVSPTGLPGVNGYNLTYLKPGANLGLQSQDDNDAPVLAFWQRGAGRSAALAAEADGQYTGGLRGWPGYRSLLERIVRWVMPAGATRDVDAVARVARQGSDLHVTLDFDPAAPPPEKVPALVVLSGDAHAVPTELALHWEDGDRMGAHFALPGSGTYYPVIQVRGRVLRAAPVTLPYSPEFEPSSNEDGHALLAALAEATGGVERISMTGLFAGTAQSAAAVPLAPVLVELALALLLAEVVLRRFFAGRRREPRRAAARSPTAVAGSVTGRRPSATEPAPAEQASGAKSAVRSVFEIAQERAQRRLKR